VSAGRPTRALPRFIVASWWQKLVYKVKVRERRRRNRRADKWQCQRCTARDTLRIVGSTMIGTRIVTCRACSNMDRRLPADRRAPGWVPRMDEVGPVAWLRLLAFALWAVAAVLVVLRWRGSL